MKIEIKREFPIVNLKDSLIECVKKIQGKPVCVVVEHGKIIRLLSQQEILSGFIEGKQNIQELFLKSYFV